MNRDNIQELIKNKEFKYSITYVIATPIDFESGIYSEKGTEVEPEEESIKDILDVSHWRYGIYNPIALGMWQSTQPWGDYEFKESGKSKYFTLHIKNIDGSDISVEEHEFITYLLSEGNFDSLNFATYASGGSVNTGLSWHLDHARHNKAEKYEVPKDKRKYEGGGQVLDSFKAKGLRGSEYTYELRSLKNDDGKPYYDVIGVFNGKEYPNGHFYDETEALEYFKTFKSQFRQTYSEGGESKTFLVDDIVYNKKTNTVGIVRLEEEKGEVQTDADGNVSVSDLEHYNPSKYAHHKNAEIAPSTSKELEEKGIKFGKGGIVNSQYLKSLDESKRKKILNNIAKHYGVSEKEIEEELIDEEAEMLYEYIANDPALRMEVYNDISKNKYAGGGGVERSYNNPKKETHVLHIDGKTWYLEKIDSTHFYMSNSPDFRGMAHHIGQHKGEPYYDEIKQWLKDTKYAGGGGLDDNFNYWRIEKDGEIIYEKTNVASPNIPNSKKISKEEYEANINKPFNFEGGGGVGFKIYFQPKTTIGGKPVQGTSLREYVTSFFNHLDNKADYVKHYYYDFDSNYGTINISNESERDLILNLLNLWDFQDATKKYSTKNEYADGGGVQDWMEVALNDLKQESGFDDLEIQNISDDENSFEASNGEVDYLVVTNNEIAEIMAIDRVKQDLIENPEYFKQDWLKNWYNIGDYFKNVYQEWNMGYATDIMTEDDDEYGNRLIHEMVDAGIMDSIEAKSDSAEDIMNERLEDFVFMMTDEQLGSDKGEKYYIDNFGEEQFHEVVKSNLSIDYDGASKNAVSVDGIGHFLSSYDGETVYLENDAVAFRNN